MWVSLPVITNAVCAQTFGMNVVTASTICTSGAGGRGPCNVSYVQYLTCNRINFANFQHSVHQTNLMVRFSEFLNTDHEVPGSNPGSTMGIFLEGEDSDSDHSLGNLVELRFNAPPGTSYTYITIHLIDTT
jgi:hypothetical protein